MSRPMRPPFTELGRPCTQLGTLFTPSHATGPGASGRAAWDARVGAAGPCPPRMTPEGRHDAASGPGRHDGRGHGGPAGGVAQAPARDHQPGWDAAPGDDVLRDARRPDRVLDLPLVAEGAQPGPRPPGD